jgi:hypothetical protein
MKKYRAISSDVLDYPSMMSMYEKESLAAEAKLCVKRAASKERKSQLNSKLKRFQESLKTSS